MWQPVSKSTWPFTMAKQDDKILADCRTIVDAVLSASLVVAMPNGGIDRYGLRLPNDQGELMMHAIGIVENGMVVRIEPQGEALEHYTAVWGLLK